MGAYNSLNPAIISTHDKSIGKGKNQKEKKLAAYYLPGIFFPGDLIKKTILVLKAGKIF
jgi:hypothetical protein